MRRRVTVTATAAAAFVASACLVAPMSASAAPTPSSALPSSASAPSATATASTPAPAPDLGVAGQARHFLDRYGVAPATATRLIRQYERGGTWLAASSANKPVTTRTVGAAGAVETISTYADGSINVLRQETTEAASPATSPGTGPGTGPAPRAISGCSKSGTAYSDCKVDFWWGVVSMSFRANYNLQSGNNRITSVYAAAWSIGGACSTSRNYFGRPATTIARLEVQGQMCVIPHNQTFWLQLKVGSNKAAFTFG